MEQLCRFFSTIMFCLVIQSCLDNENLIVSPDIDDSYYFYYDSQLFSNVDSCHFVGELRSETDDKFYYINRKYKICSDTVYVIKKKIVNQHNIFYGNIFIENKPHLIYSKLK